MSDHLVLLNWKHHTNCHSVRHIGKIKHQANQGTNVVDRRRQMYSDTLIVINVSLYICDHSHLRKSPAYSVGVSSAR
jgi:hypothetical protein